MNTSHMPLSALTHEHEIRLTVEPVHKDVLVRRTVRRTVVILATCTLAFSAALGLFAWGHMLSPDEPAHAPPSSDALTVAKVAAGEFAVLDTLFSSTNVAASR